MLVSQCQTAAVQMKNVVFVTNWICKSHKKKHKLSKFWYLSVLLRRARRGSLLSRYPPAFLSSFLWGRLTTSSSAGGGSSLSSEYFGCVGLPSRALTGLLWALICRIIWLMSSSFSLFASSYSCSRAGPNPNAIDLLEAGSDLKSGGGCSC